MTKKKSRKNFVILVIKVVLRDESIGEILSNFQVTQDLTQF